MNKLFNGKFKKAVTFSFDDGNIDDIRLIEILNKYGLKGTFNLNSGCLSGTSGFRYNDIKDVRHINYFDCPNLYEGHEIACHGYTHPHLDKLETDTAYNEIMLDKKILEYLYNRKVSGMAYPYGTYSKNLYKILKDCGIKYCRTAESSFSFSLPENPLEWHTTCHFRYSGILDLAHKFLDNNTTEAMLFSIWGHSYELVTEEDWQEFENFCILVSGKDDIFYCTNSEALQI